MARITVTVSGPTGSGKSRIALEIQVALQAAGIKVEWPDIDDQRQMEAEAHSEANGGYQPAMPDVVLQEINTPITIADGFRRTEAHADGEKLWLWRNGDHYLAFVHEYPTYDGGDPMTLGEPAATAVFRVSSAPA